MGSTARGRAALVFLLTFALGEFLAFALVSKTISQRRGGPLEITIHWQTFLILSAVAVLVACVCAYRTWRGQSRATAAPEAP